MPTILTQQMPQLFQSAAGLNTRTMFFQLPPKIFKNQSEQPMSNETVPLVTQQTTTATTTTSTKTTTASNTTIKTTPTTTTTSGYRRGAIIVSAKTDGDGAQTKHYASRRVKQTLSALSSSSVSSSSSSSSIFGPISTVSQLKLQKSSISQRAFYLLQHEPAICLQFVTSIISTCAMLLINSSISIYKNCNSFYCPVAKLLT